jgi:hypothetical protein
MLKILLRQPRRKRSPSQRTKAGVQTTGGRVYPVPGRGELLNARIAAHEIGHALTSSCIGAVVESRINNSGWTVRWPVCSTWLAIIAQLAQRAARAENRCCIDMSAPRSARNRGGSRRIRRGYHAGTVAVISRSAPLDRLIRLRDHAALGELGQPPWLAELGCGAIS